MIRLLAALSVATLLVACGGGDSTGAGGAGNGSGGGGSASDPGSCVKGKDSCSPGTAFCCADYAGSFTPTSVKAGCDRSGGTYSPDTCTTAHLEASCTLYKGTAAEKTIRYYEGYDASSMSDPMTNCAALHGTYEGN